MERAPIIAHHLIWTAYGSWLPNDPRGSGSRSVNSDVIAELGELHHGRKKVQPPGCVVRDFYKKAGQVLRFPLLELDETARLVVGDAFAEVVRQRRYTCYACAIMPDHVHILIRVHRDRADTMVEQLQAHSRNRLCEAGCRAADHPTWTAGTGWKVFLHHPDDITRTIRYIERNPIKIHLPAQRWSFVSAYDGWPLHPGHNPNSPYALALRKTGRYPH